jgi:signal transduction histidine kinase
MRIGSPAFTLASLLAAAGVVFGSGWRLAARSEEKHVPPDRTVLREFAAKMQRRLMRLEEVFQADLRELAGETATANDASVPKLCDSIYGIVQFSRLTGNASRDRHVPVHPDQNAQLPLPVLGAGISTPAEDGMIILPPEETSTEGQAPDFGWFIPGSPRFWVVWKHVDQKDQTEVEAFLIDRSEVIARVDSYLRRWIEKPFAPVRAAKGLEMVERPRGGSLAGLAKAPEGRDPDLVLPLISRFGDWQIVAWDRTIRHVFYDPATLALTSTIAAILAMLGLVLFTQQRQAARLAEQRVSFVNRVSHELSAPLTNTLMNLDLIEERSAELPEMACRRLRLVREETQRLGRLVSNVLTFSRSERHPLAPNPAEHLPDEIIHSVLQQFQPALERRGMQTNWSGAAKERMYFDGDALSQIVANLISNAEKYAANGKHLEIDSRMENGELSIRICDRGPGIPRSQAARVFEPFERLNNRVNEGSSGAGLGLTIARDLAHSMGGQLRLLDNSQGASFELRLPMKKGRP